MVSYSLAYCIFYKISSSAHSTALIGQFVSDVAWGELDVLLVDTPPGTSDEHLAVLENMKKHSRVDGAILVTTPQVTTVLDTKKKILQSSIGTGRSDSHKYLLFLVY